MKKGHTYTLILLLISSMLYSCSDDDRTNNTIIQNIEFRQELNVSYGDENDQVFDIYLPANRSMDTKVVILIHGGGWTSGDKEDMNIFLDLFLEDQPDLAVVNMNYRLADEDNLPYPMQIEDIASVVNFLQTIRTFI